MERRTVKLLAIVLFAFAGVVDLVTYSGSVPFGIAFLAIAVILAGEGLCRGWH